MINPNDLRALADYLDERPKLAANLYLTTNAWCSNKAEWQELLDEMGSFEKRGFESTYALTARHAIGRINVDVNVSRTETCTKREVGVKKVEREVYPADVKPAIEVVEEPVYEWVCPDTWKERT